MKLGSTPIPEKEVDQSIQYDIETSKEKEKEKENSNNELAESIQRKLMNIFEKVDLLRTEPCLKLLRDLENYLDFTSDLPIDDVVNFNEIIQKGLSAGLTPLHVALIMLRPLYSHSKDITEKMFDRFMDRLNFNIQSTHSDYQGNTALMELALYQIGIDLTVSSPKKSFLDMVFSKLKLATLDFNAMSNKGTPLSILAKLYNTQTSQQHFLKKCLEQIPLELDFTVAVDEGKTIRDLLEKSNIIDKVDLIILLREIKSLVIERNNDDIDSALKVQLGKAQDLAAKIYRCCEDTYGYDLFMNVCIDFIEIKLFKEKFDESMKFFKERHKQISGQRQERYNSWFEKARMLCLIPLHMKVLKKRESHKSI